MLKILFSFSLLALSAALSLCARKIPGFAQAFSAHVYAVSERLFGLLWGRFPFSISEIGLYALIGLILSGWCIFSAAPPCSLAGCSLQPPAFSFCLP